MKNSLMDVKLFFAVILFSFFSTANAAPLALIYKGPGSCSAEEGDAGDAGYGCSEASADAAMLAGFRYKYIGPKDLNESSTPEQVKALFENGSVWIQPGGVSNVAYYAMTPRLRKELVEFVKNGGGFVGFCAGAFLAADWFYIFPGYASLYRYSSVRYDVTYTFLKTTWGGKEKQIYFEGGPYLHSLGKDVEVMARFSSGAIAAARAPFGKGRVYITGAHPEAPPIWSGEDNIVDPDGSDLQIAADMITWAAKIIQ